jgi:hypothetical protein
MDKPKKATVTHITPTEADENRFWSQVEKTNKDDDECWLWKGRINIKDRPEFFIKGQNIGAQRVAWVLSREKQLPTEHYIYPSNCKNHKCVRPEHLGIKRGRGKCIKNRNKKVIHPVDIILKGGKKRIVGWSKARFSKELLETKHSLGVLISSTQGLTGILSKFFKEFQLDTISRKKFTLSAKETIGTLERTIMTMERIAANNQENHQILMAAIEEIKKKQNAIDNTIGQIDTEHLQTFLLREDEKIVRNEKKEKERKKLAFNKKEEQAFLQTLVNIFIRECNITLDKITEKDVGAIQAVYQHVILRAETTQERINLYTSWVTRFNQEMRQKSITERKTADFLKETLINYISAS